MHIKNSSKSSSLQGGIMNKKTIVVIGHDDECRKEFIKWVKKELLADEAVKIIYFSQIIEKHVAGVWEDELNSEGYQLEEIKKYKTNMLPGLNYGYYEIERIFSETIVNIDPNYFKKRIDQNVKKYGNKYHLIFCDILRIEDIVYLKQNYKSRVFGIIWKQKDKKEKREYNYYNSVSLLYNWYRQYKEEGGKDSTLLTPTGLEGIIDCIAIHPCPYPLTKGEKPDWGNLMKPYIRETKRSTTRSVAS